MAGDEEELERLRARLHDVEEQFDLLVDRATEHAIFQVDPEGIVVRWNPGAARLLGYQEEEILGRSGDIFFIPEDREAGVPAKELACAAETGAAEDDRWHQRKEGERIFVTGAVTPMRREDGSLRGFWKIMRDRTEARRLQDALHAASERFEFAQRTAGFGTFEWNMRDQRIIWTDALAELYGITLADFSGDFAGWKRFILDEDVPEAERLFHLIMEGRQDRVEGRYRIRRPDGDVRWMGLTCSVQRRADGSAESVIGINADITEQKRDKDRLRQVNLQLEHFAAITSHDLSQPLRMVSNYLSLLHHRIGQELDPQAGDYLRLARDGAERMRRLIMHLLDIARLGHEEIRLEPVCSLASFAEAVENLGSQIDEAGAVVTHDNLPQVLGHRGDLARLFQNLIGNALKYARPGVPPSIHVSARPSEVEGEWLVSVSDNGIGIPEADRGRLFTLYERLDRGSTAPGTGLGLAICRMIVERHGGRIWVSSRPGEGSTFHFTLRAA